MTQRTNVTRAVTQAVADLGNAMRIGVACSGGTDSMALAHAVIAEAGAARVVVTHVDHGLQAGSAGLARRVASWARNLGAVAVIRRVMVANTASLEAAARTARYSALDDVVAKHRLGVMFTAHTQDDQAETVLMRMVRGTGVAGLAAIAQRRGHYVRPLLEIRRRDTAHHVEVHNVSHWHDPMNDDRRFTRVRARHEWLPMLADHNPKIVESLARLANQSASWRDVLQHTAAALVVDEAIDCRVVTNVAEPVLAMAIAELGVRAGVALESAHLSAASKLARAPSRGRKQLDVPGGVIVRDYHQLRVETPGSAAPHSPPPSVNGPQGAYLLRTYQPGDRMRPARLRGRSRKLSDLFVDARIPQALRATAWVACDEHGTIVWAEYLGNADGAEISVTLAASPARKSRHLR